MEKKFKPQGMPVWTWADQISTYRFWGLLIFYFLSTISLGVLSNNLGIFLRNELGMNYSLISLGFLATGVGVVFGFYLAWATARYKTKILLITAGIIQLTGVLLIAAPESAAVPIFLRMAGAFLLGLGFGAISLAVPSILAGGRGGAEAFALAFGVMYILTEIGQLEATMIFSQLWGQFGYSALGTVTAAQLILGLLLLLPVHSSFFGVMPPQRGYSLPPTHREPILVAIGCILPFYWLYWLYRAHGEVASLAPYAPSRTILSPRASIWASILVPLIDPILVTSLADALNKHAFEMDRPAYRRSWAVFLLSLLFYPAAMALVQSTMNRVMEERPTGEPA